MSGSPRPIRRPRDVRHGVVVPTQVDRTLITVDESWRSARGRTASINSLSVSLRFAATAPRRFRSAVKSRKALGGTLPRKQRLPSCGAGVGVARMRPRAAARAVKHAAHVAAPRCCRGRRRDAVGRNTAGRRPFVRAASRRRRVCRASRGSTPCQQRLPTSSGSRFTTADLHPCPIGALRSPLKRHRFGRVGKGRVRKPATSGLGTSRAHCPIKKRTSRSTFAGTTLYDAHARLQITFRHAHERFRQLCGPRDAR